MVELCSQLFFLNQSSAPSLGDGALAFETTTSSASTSSASSSTPQPVFEITLSSASTSSAPSSTPLSSTPTPQSLPLTVAASSVVAPPGPIKTSASVTASGSSGSPSSPGSHQGPESTGLSSAAKVGIGLGVPLGVLLCAIIAFFLLRYYRSKTPRGTSPRELYVDTEEKAKGESPRVQEIRDDGVVRELY